MADSEDVHTANRTDRSTHDIANPQREARHPNMSSSAPPWSYEEIFERHSELTLQDDGDSEPLEFFLQHLSSSEASNEYVQYAADRLTNMVRSNTEYSVLTSTTKFKNALLHLNWRPGDEYLAIVINRLEGGTYKNLPLGTFADHWLALQPSTRAMIPDEVDFDTIEAHDISVVNPNIVLGARFEALTQEKKTESFNFVQLGRRLFLTLSPS